MNLINKVINSNLKIREAIDIISFNFKPYE